MPRRFYIPKQPVNRNPQQPRREVRSRSTAWSVVIMIGAVIVVAMIWMANMEKPESPTAVGTNMDRWKHVPETAMKTDTNRLVENYSENMAVDREEEAMLDDSDFNDNRIAPAKDISGKAIRLQILNGCGEKGIAKLIAPPLRAMGFDVRETSNAGSFNYVRSLVYDRIGVLENALAVAESLGVEPSNVSTQLSKNLVDIDVTLIVGADYKKLRLEIPERKRR